MDHYLLSTSDLLSKISSNEFTEYLKLEVPLITESIISGHIKEILKSYIPELINRLTIKIKETTNTSSLVSFISKSSPTFGIPCV